VRLSTAGVRMPVLETGVAGTTLPRMHRTVLIVDDHALFRTAARALLEADDFEVVGDASDASTGLDAARRLQPDVVLLDVRLPDGDGFELAARLTADGDGPIVVVTSSSDDPRYPDCALRSGAVGFVAKQDIAGTSLHALLS